MPALQPAAAVSRTAPLVASAAAAALFAVARPGVPDLQAALARGAAAAHGVGLSYWFQWFGGASPPGRYSVLTPYAAAWIGAPLLGALATIASTAVVALLVRGSAHAGAATWVAAASGTLSLWSGRIAFAVGVLFAVLALLALRRRRTVLAMVPVALTVFSSPVCAVFLAGAFAAVVLRDVTRRRAALLLLGECGAGLLALLVSFGAPGAAIFRPLTALGVAACSLGMLLARPARAVRVVAWATAASALLLLLVPTGMGSNLARMSTICLPVAVVATAAARRWVVALVVAPALAIAAGGTIHDLVVAAQPAASTAYYDTLAHRLDRIGDLANYRLEVVQSRSFHTADYALLEHAALATGWETQTQSSLDSVLDSPTLGAARYRAWLDDNAVGYLAFDTRTRAYDPEYKLVRRGLPYLSAVWSDSTWTLYRVARPTPIIAAPATVVHAAQAALTVHVPCACRVLLRVHWSRYLTATDDTRHGRDGVIARDPSGWSAVTVRTPGTYEIEGGF